MYEWNRNEDAGRFVSTYADLILRLSLAHGLTRQDAQDICQELFLRLLTGRKSFRSAEHEKAWVIRSAGNACKNLLRSAYRKKRVSIETVENELENTALPQSDRELLTLIGSLPEKLKDAVALHYLEGYSLEESARLLGISNAAVRKRLERARKLLKNELEGVLT